ncbi:MAG: anthranilate/aminodeoxychorismate synthase component II [Thiotrichales bacterium]|nr:MAG: anthranilate/aminodeoxychorismate synthase component II [Thiotrichales bacterium]
MTMKILMVDNYDKRNDEISADDIEAIQPDKIILSPGPCTPNEAGISLEVVEKYAGRIPLLGVCLGHQSIGQAFGGDIVRAREIMHGKISAMHHNGQGLFAGLPNPFNATRYHSLVIDKNTLPDCLEMTAWTETEDGEPDEIMGVRHKTLAVEGVQYHPESILSEHGHAQLRNFMEQS